MIPVDELFEKYKGRPAAVLGGGPSLPEDLKRLPDDCLLIAVNDHALHFCEPDYLVFMDIPDPDKLPELYYALHTYEGIKVSPQMDLTDVNVRTVKYWDGGFTSTFATWFGLYLGCDPLLLCGMDCYQGEVKYCHPRPNFHHPVFDFPLENHLRAWRLCFKHLERASSIRAVSGPLVQVFGQYDAQTV